MYQHKSGAEKRKEKKRAHDESISKTAKLTDFFDGLHRSTNAKPPAPVVHVATGLPNLPGNESSQGQVKNRWRAIIMLDLFATMRIRRLKSKIKNTIRT